MQKLDGAHDSREGRISAIAETTTMAAIAVLGLLIVLDSIRLGLESALGIGPGMFPLISGAALLLLGVIGLYSAVVALWRVLRTSLPSEPSGMVAPEGPMTPDSKGDTLADVLSVKDEVPEIEPEMFTTVMWGRLAIAGALIFAFVVAMPWLGFIVSLVLFMFFMLKFVAGRGIVLTLILTLATSLVVYYGFGILLDVALPGPSCPLTSCPSWMNL
jgi:hypothetical protein